jgi:hypothetical protein
MPGAWGGSTRRGTTVYLHITQNWNGRLLRLPPLPRKILRAKVLTGGSVDVKQSETDVSVTIAANDLHPLDTIVELELDGDSLQIQPIPAAKDHWESLTVNANTSASSAVLSWAGMHPICVALHGWEKGAPASHKLPLPEGLPSAEAKLLERPRGHIWRYWMANEKDTQPWLELDLGGERRFDRVCLREKFNRILGFELQYKANENWVTFHKGTTLDQFSLVLPEPLSARKVRLVITAWQPNGDNPLRGPGIQEFDLYLTQ